MRRWTPKTRAWVYRFLVERSGEICLLCQKPKTKSRRLEIDHIDQNTNNDQPDNLALICSRCNKKLNALSPSQHKRLLSVLYANCVCVSENFKGNNQTELTKRLIDYQQASPEMKANDLFEVKYREWVLAQVREYGGTFSKKEAINSGAEIIGCSPATITRYLDKLTSLEGVLTIEKSPLHQTIIKIKPEVEERLISPALSVEELITLAKRYRGK